MRKRIPVLTWFAILATLTLLLALVVPPSPTTLHTLHISVMVYREVIIAIYLTYILIWLTAFYAFDKLESYSKRLGNSAEGKAFSKISIGTGLLAWGLAIPTILSLSLSPLTINHPGFATVRIIIDNYATLIFVILGFTYIGDGIHQLVLFAKAHGTMRAIRTIFSIVALVGVFFTYFALHNHFAHSNPYRLPIALLLATIVAPYLYVWSTGLMGAYELWRYARTVKGVLYHSALNTLGAGLVVVILSSITVQYVTSSLGGGTNLGLGSIILILYGLFVIMGIGYVFVAIGANRLKRIEEV